MERKGVVRKYVKIRDHWNQIKDYRSTQNFQRKAIQNRRNLTIKLQKQERKCPI